MQIAKSGLCALAVVWTACTSADQAPVTPPPVAPATASSGDGPARQISADSAESTTPAVTTAPPSTPTSPVAAGAPVAAGPAAVLPAPVETSATATSAAPNTAAMPATTSAAAATTVSTDGSTVIFHIAAGTGNGAWNSAATAIPLRSGQKLQVVNDDSVAHWVHSNEFFPGTGGGPFPHPGAGIDPGQSATYSVDSNYSGQLHDHLTEGPIFFSTATK